ncbi:BrnT family toxin [Skermanella pratensis]|uniref:BrnT family toxin n=1 Tax=Skermanella pratensis TaxID=2233999 RepID=UPI001FE3F4B3|nr:BrnT family toxin [Skermanella pratensis]
MDGIKISFDPNKDAVNQRDHHLSLAFGKRVMAGRVFEFSDTRFAYGEERLVCFGYVEGRLHVCVYTVREDTVRIISVRKANDR